MQSFISGVSVAMNVNDDIEPYFEKKGVILCLPFCSILANMLDILINIETNKLSNKWFDATPYIWGIIHTTIC